jgi:hypothetical protein
MFGKKLIVTSLVGVASMALPALVSDSRGPCFLQAERWDGPAARFSGFAWLAGRDQEQLRNPRAHGKAYRGRCLEEIARKFKDDGDFHGTTRNLRR